MFVHEKNYVLLFWSSSYGIYIWVLQETIENFAEEFLLIQFCQKYTLLTKEVLTKCLRITKRLTNFVKLLLKGSLVKAFGIFHEEQQMRFIFIHAMYFECLSFVWELDLFMKENFSNLTIISLMRSMRTMNMMRITLIDQEQKELKRLKWIYEMQKLENRHDELLTQQKLNSRKS